MYSREEEHAQATTQPSYNIKAFSRHSPCASQAGGFGWVDDDQMRLPEHERMPSALQGAHAEFVRVPLAEATCLKVCAVQASALVHATYKKMHPCPSGNVPMSQWKLLAQK